MTARHVIKGSVHNRVHHYPRLNEQELAATADVKKPNRFQRRVIAKQKQHVKAAAVKIASN